MRRHLSFILLVLAASACNGNTAPVPVPTPVAPPTVTEHYSGTLFVLGNNLHSFQVAQSSEVDVTLVSVATVPVTADSTANPPVVAVPSVPVTAALTITVGQPTLTTVGVQCSDLMQVQAPAGTQPQLKGQALSGAYCVSISDPNNVLPSAVTYAITVGHS
jgi:hypothetical protein